MRGRLDLDLHIQLGAKFQFTVPLRNNGTIVLYTSTQKALLEMLPLTSIAMPVDQYDPSGRFARHNFPSNLTIDDAIELVRHPPRSADH